MGAKTENRLIDFFIARASRESGLSYDYLFKVKKIMEVAKTDPEIAAAWENIKKTNGGDTEVEDLYQLALQKEKVWLEN
jgi:hypothetical protein